MSSNDEDIRLPSMVTDKPWLRCFSIDYDADNVPESTLGKWMIFRSRDEKGRAEIDRMWLQIIQQFNENDLYLVTVTTALINPEYKDGAICCFTRDYSDVDDVLETASKLRDILGPDFRDTIYYKPQHARSQYIDSMQYKHLANGQLWYRVGQEQWELYEFDDAIIEDP